MERVGSEWESFCELLTDETRKETEKSLTMKKRMNHYRRETMRSRQAESELSKTK